MRKLLMLSVCLAVLLIPAIALAAIPDLAADPFGFVTAIVNAIVAKNWTLVIAFATSGLVVAMRWGLPRFPALVKRPDWSDEVDAILKSDPMGVALAWLAGFAMALAAASPAAFSWALCKEAALYACGAMGVFATVWKFAAPLAKIGLEWLTRKIGLKPGADIAAEIRTETAAAAEVHAAETKAGPATAADIIAKIQ